MDLTYIAEGLRPLAIALGDLTPDPANAKVHGRKNLDAIRASLTQFGQVKPLAVRKSDMVVIAGNGRLRVARDLGWTHVACVLMEGTPAELTAFALADNKTAELAEWDDVALADALRSIGEQAVDVGSLGWNDKELAALLDAEDPLPPPVIPPAPEVPDAPTEPTAEPPPRAADKAQAPKSRAAARPDPAAGITADDWAALAPALARVRADRDEPDLSTGACLRALARRYLGRPLDTGGPAP